MDWTGKGKERGEETGRGKRREERKERELYGDWAVGIPYANAVYPYM